MLAQTQLDRIEAAQAGLAADLAGLRSEMRFLLLNVITREIKIMANIDVLNAALDALNIATSQESALLKADGDKLDKIQALITDLVTTGGVPQSVLDKAAAIQAAIADVATTTTAQAARLDQLGQDPRNPVPVAPPVVR